MTMVIDASVAAKWFFEEEFTQNALFLISADRDLIAPDVILPEVCNVAWRRVLDDGFSAAQARSIALALPDLLAMTIPSDELIGSALDLALELQHPVYDCMYLALSQARQVGLVTADRKLLRRLAECRWPGEAFHLSEVL
jgi:predicted nucleic acid-binding protein